MCVVRCAGWCRSARADRCPRTRRLRPAHLAGGCRTRQYHARRAALDGRAMLRARMRPTGSTVTCGSARVRLEDAAGERAVLVSCDLLGMHRALSQAICQALEQRCGLAPRVRWRCASATRIPGPSWARTSSRCIIGCSTPNSNSASIGTRSGCSSRSWTACSRRSTICSRVTWSGDRAPATFAVNRRNNPEAEGARTACGQPVAGTVRP